MFGKYGLRYDALQAFIKLLQLEKAFHPDQPSLFPQHIREFITTRLNARWKLFATRIHIAAFLLDPRFRETLSSSNEELVETQFKEAEEFILEFAAEKNWESLRASWIRFRAKQGTFSTV
jgi:hypothetical protein